MIKKIKYGVSVLSISMLLGFSPNSLTSDIKPDDGIPNISYQTYFEVLENDLSNKPSTFLKNLDNNEIHDNATKSIFLGKVLNHIFDLNSPLNQTFMTEKNQTQYHNLIKILENYDTALIPYIKNKMQQATLKQNEEVYQNSSFIWKAFMSPYNMYYTPEKISLALDKDFFLY
ncbi:MAG: hypothetical protein ACRYGR_02110 [Janthinobacterium lividum]